MSRTLTEPSGRIDTTIVQTEIVGTYITTKTARSAAIEYAFTQFPGQNIELLGAWPIQSRGKHDSLHVHGRGKHGSYNIWEVEVLVLDDEEVSL